MPVDYSKWDKLELSDDSDIEVHPNVDKQSFIKWKQREIHEKREMSRMREQQLDINIETNQDLLVRVDRLIEASKAGTPVGKDIEESVKLSSAGETKDRPAKATSPKQPKYSDMIESMLTQITQQAGNEKEVLAKLEEHRGMIANALADETKELEKLKAERANWIRSEDIKDGWNTTLIGGGKKSDVPDTSASAAASSAKVAPSQPSSTKTEVVETLHKPASSTVPEKPKKNEDGLEELLPATEQLGKVPQGDLAALHRFIRQHPNIATEGQKDALMMSAFNTEFAGDTAATERIVYNATVLQYCALLGPAAVDSFFSRLAQKNHPAREAFDAEVQKTYRHICDRCKVLSSEKQDEEAVEQIQLHAVDPDTEISVEVPAEGSEGRAIFDKFPKDMRDAIETRDLEQINKVLGAMPLSEAEELVGELGESGVLVVEQKIYDTAQWNQKQEELAAEGQARAPDVPHSTVDELD